MNKKILFLLSLALCPSLNAAPAFKPNIIMIMVDTLRADYLGCYGFQGAISPNIDAFANESLLFSQCLVQASWTKPSVATLFTGLYPESHRVFMLDRGVLKKQANVFRMDTMPQEAVTLTEVLKLEGYQTLGFVSNPLVFGIGYGQGFDVYEERGIGNGFDASGILSRAKKLVQERDPQKPLFLYLHYMDVHAPYRGTEEDAALLEDSPSLGPRRMLTPKERRTIHMAIRRSNLKKDPAVRKQLVKWRAAYAAGVHRFDKAMPDLFNFLKESDLFDTSVIIFLSDHGEELCEHGAWEHGDRVYAEQIHVPLIVRMPGGKFAGTKVDGTVGVVDLMPTLMDYIGAKKTPPGMQGRNFSRVLRDGKSHAFKYSFAAANSDRLLKFNESCIQSSTHKLIWDLSTDKKRLFDLEKDPQEQVDISAFEPKITATLSKELQSHKRRVEAYRPFENKAEPVPADVAEKIKSLGYMQ